METPTLGSTNTINTQSRVQKDRGSDKGGGVVQMVLVDTERNAQGAQLQNASACTFFQLQNEEHNSFWLGK